MSERVALEKTVQELQMVSQQISTIQSQLGEIDGTLTYLERQNPEHAVYQQIGPLLVEVDDMDHLVDELNQSKAHLSTHLDKLQVREQELRSAYQNAVEEFESS